MLPWKDHHQVLPSMLRAIEAVAAAAEAAAGNDNSNDQFEDDQQPRLDERNVSRRTTRSMTPLHGGSGQMAHHQPPSQRRRRQTRVDAERLWLHYNGDSFKSAEHVLDVIGSVLEEKAMQRPTGAASSSSSNGRVNPPRITFLIPLLHPRSSSSSSFHPRDAECMCYDIVAVQSRAHLNIDGQGYIQVYLAYDRRLAVSGPEQIREGAHRIVLWFVCGPPDDVNHVAMHYCNNTRCLNPLHLAWGTRQENFDDGRRGGDTANEAMRRIMERMAPSTSQNAPIDLQ
jgi:hypothetical protein